MFRVLGFCVSGFLFQISCFGFCVSGFLFLIVDINLNGMSTIQRFEDLDIWKMARELAHSVYKCYSQDEGFARDYKLREQINAASGSIMDNIAEGFERDGRNEFVNFLSIAKGSLGEVKSQLYRAYDRNYINEKTLEETKEQCNILGSKIGKLIKYLNESEIRGSKFKNRTTKR